jgi:hypothetical protein
VRRPARRKLDPTELSWIIEGQMSGKYPIRMFPRPESPSSQVIPLPEAKVQISGEGDSEIKKQGIGEK